MRLLPRIVLVLVAAACRGEMPAAGGDVVLDLAATLAATDAAPATATVRAADRAHLLQGWDAVDTDGGEPRVWLAGGRGVLWFDAGPHPVPRTLVLTAVTSARPRPLLVRVNQRLLAPLRPRDGRQELRVALPVDVQRPGRNVLELIVPGGLARRRGLLDPRAFALIELRFEADTPPPAGATADGERLVLPAGAEVTWFVAMPPAAALVWDGEDPVAVTVEADGGVARAPGVSRTRTGRVADLGPEAGRLARLTLAARTSAAVLGRPRLVGRPGVPPLPPAALGGRPHVILYVADTLRADRLGCYGRAAAVTPHLDALAREGVVFEDAVAQSSWTRPAVASILTGRWPHEHGAASLMGAMRPDLPTLPELLGGAGYATAAFVTNLNVAARFGFGRGFERFTYLPEDDGRPEVYAPATTLHAAALPWLDQVGDRPFFLWLHASDPHAPYRPGPADAARFVPPGLAPPGDEALALRTLFDRPALATPDTVAYLSALYDGEVAALDRAIGDLVAELRRRGLDRSTLVVFVGDHGEEFHEHGGLEHGRTLYDEVTRVPLVVRLPGGAGGGRRVADPVRQVDVLPTVLALAGVPAPPGLPGRAVLGSGAGGAEEALLETELDGRALVGLVRGPWKAVFDEIAGTSALYDRSSDPGERTSVAAARPIVLGYARQAIARRRLGAGAGPSTAVVDPETEQRLRALGYLD